MNIQSSVAVDSSLSRRHDDVAVSLLVIKGPFPRVVTRDPRTSVGRREIAPRKAKGHRDVIVKSQNKIT